VHLTQNLPADLRHICRVGRILAADDQSQVSFLITQGTLPWQPISAVAARRQLVAQPGGLALGFALHLVCTSSAAVIVLQHSDLTTHCSLQNTLCCSLNSEHAGSAVYRNHSSAWYGAY